jgi:ABC-type nitrate/sulfonate/bicarbonate transport system substrate-binding protein
MTIGIIKVGYVPEHFSTPLFLAQERGFFRKEGVEIKLVECPGGTGEMTQKLQEGAIDVALALTEGLVAGLAKGQDWYKIVGTYVDSSLHWAISTGAHSRHSDISTLKSSTAAISRNGSGSHIMAYVLADQEQWLTSPQDVEQTPFRFEIKNNFKTMRDAVNSDAADFFLWETFTTKPWHDSGEIRKLGEIVPPWSAFMIAASTKILAQDCEGLRKFFRGVEEGIALFMNEKEGASLEWLQKQFGYSDLDVKRWFDTVSYPARVSVVEMEKLNITSQILIKAGVLDKPIDLNSLIDIELAEIVA